jgi:hypothetical protein
MSLKAERNFRDGLNAGDIVIYNGHSRDGGGPDFNPPKTIPGGHVNYDWYQAHTPGLNMVLDGLVPGSGHPKVLGLFSCVSGKHFSQRVIEREPSMGLVTSEELLYYSDALANSVGAINALLGFWCKEPFDQAIRSRPSKADSKIQNFFRTSPRLR